MEEFFGTIQLGVGHSLILGHVPPVVDPAKLSSLINDNPTTEVESFGLWESSSPNYSTYYPEVTAEDLKPKDDEFIEPVFRLLSEVIVYKGVPIDFTKKGVLKASMKKLLGQTVNIDHEVMVGNAIGAVSQVFWQDSYKTASGITVPAGINGKLKIDGKSNPRIARGIMMNPPSIHSNSVTVRYKWEPSHKFENKSDFYEKVGTYDKDGQLIRCVVTEVISYSETSLVSHGADPFAQKVEENGQIVNPEYAVRTAAFSADKKLTGHVFYDLKEFESGFMLDATIPESFNNNNNNEIGMEELIKSLTTELGFKEGDLTQENLGEKLIESFKNKETQIQTLTDNNSTLETDKENLTNSLSDLQGKYDTLEADSKEVDNVLKLTREEATRLYQSVHGEEGTSGILQMIADADLKMATAFLKQYRKEAEDKFSASCKDCGSTNVSRVSASSSREGIVNEDEDEGEGNSNFKEKSNAEVIASFKNSNRRKSILFKDNENK